MSKMSDNVYRAQCEKYHLHPGYIYVIRKPAIITTVLGSCISLCLYDRQLKYGGMNHYIFPRLIRNDENTARYGTAALPALLNIFMEFGSKKENLIARIIGGAWLEISEDSRQIAEENSELAHSFCRKHGIKLLSEDVGGTMGRKIVYFTELNEILVTMVEKTEETYFNEVKEHFQDFDKQFRKET